ncbi:MAG: hypothetical protein AB7O97_05945 [Planctomycetota bacterium]
MSPIPLRTGNLSVPRIEAACRGRVTEPNDLGRELAVMQARGFDEVEDYVAWAVVEPAPDRWDWDEHRAHAAAARAAGMRWVPFVWAHALPAWYRASADFRPTVCLETGAVRNAPSLFAEQTRAFVARFYTALAAGLGDLVETLVVGFPADYGEVGFVSGVADWIVGRDDEPFVRYACGDPEARARLGPTLRAPAPDDPPARRLEFARAYRGAITTWTAWLLDLARAHFPRARLELKLGHGSEELRFGVDQDAVVGVAAARGVGVRSTHSGLVPMLTRRIASLCRTRGAAFLAEGPRDHDELHLRRRSYFDAIEGAAGWFEFPEQQERIAADFAAVRPALGSGPALRTVAVHYPSVDLDLQPGLPISEALMLCHDALQRCVDFDLRCCGQVARGELDGVDTFVWLDGAWTTARAWRQLDEWVRAGGTLVLGGPPPRLLDDDDRDLGPAALGDTPVPCYRLAAAEAAPARFALDPGHLDHRLWLGRGWHGRDDGARAFGSATPLPCRWTSALAECALPRPPAGAALELRVFGDVPVELEVALDGRVAATARVERATALRVDVPPGADPMLRCALRARPLRSRHPDERRDLGVLVHRIGYGGGPPPDRDDDATATFAAALRPAASAVHPHGAGQIIRGDDTPLFARTALLARTDGRVHGGYVARMPRGVLLHNPDRRRPWTFAPQNGAPATLAGWETRWLPDRP